MGERKPFKIEALSVADKNEVVQFLRAYLYKDEPLNSTLGIKDCVDQENWLCGGLADCCSFKAVNDDGDMVAIKLNAISHRNAKFELKTDDPLFHIGLKLVYHIGDVYNPFDAFPDGGDRMVEGKIITVRDDFRNHGIATALYRRTTDWMVEHGIKHMFTMCTSHYTALACKKLGYAEVFSMNYSDFVVNGVCPILPKLPHTKVRAYMTTVQC